MLDPISLEGSNMQRLLAHIWPGKDIAAATKSTPGGRPPQINSRKSPPIPELEFILPNACGNATRGCMWRWIVADCCDCGSGG
jgi:hypothetical protein